MNNFTGASSTRSLFQSLSFTLTRRVFVLVLTAALAWSCNDDDNGPKGKYEHGALIVNEGKFGSGNGTLMHYDLETGVTEQNIFLNAAGSFAGDVLQSVAIDGDRALLVLNGDNKIEVADANTFTRTTTLEFDELDKPQQAVVVNNTAYVSVWGPYSDGGYDLVDSYVLAIDLNNNTVIKKIATDEGTTDILAAGNFVFASNNNFGGSKTLAVVNPSSNTLEKQLELSDGPAGMVVDANGKLWVICSGSYGVSNGKIFCINTSTLAIEKKFDLNYRPGGDLAISPDKKTILYNVGNNIFSFASDATTPPTTPLFQATDVISLYALGVNPENGDIWIGDAEGYAAPGKVYIYTNKGVAKPSFQAGISPTAFVFK